MMSDVTFVATRRNGRALCFGGFFYHINKSVDERSYWKCRTKGCKSTVVTINDVISSASGQHFHDPNDSRVLLVNDNNNHMISNNNNSNNVVKNGLQTDNNSKQLIHIKSGNNFNNNNNNKKQRTSDEFSNHSFSNKKSKSNNSMKTINNNSMSLITEHLNNEEVIDSFVQHLNVEIEVDECGKVKIEDIDESYCNNELNSDFGESSEPKHLQLMPNIKPNNVYFTNSYASIEHFDIELNNLFKVIRQSGFKSVDIEQLSNDWELWKKRFLELKKAKNKSKQFCGSEREVENLKLQLEIALNAKNNAEKEFRRVELSLRESQNNVSALRLVLRKNLNNGSNNQCIALLNEINELKRKVCAQVEAHQSNLNQVKRLLSLDDNDLRTEFDQLAQERDDALRDNLLLKQELTLLRSRLSLMDKSD